MLNYTILRKPLAALCIVSVAFAACENSQEDVFNFNRKKLTVETAKDVNIQYSMAGRIKAILTAPLLKRVQDSVFYAEFPNKVHVDFYNEFKQKESVLDALYARYNENDKKVFLKDSIRVINILKGDTLYCNELYWDRSRIGNEFYTDKPVKVRTRTIRQDGTGMNASQDFKNWAITYPVGSMEMQEGIFTGQ